MKKISNISIAFIILDLILIYIFDLYVRGSYILFTYINGIILLSVLIVNVVNIIITLKKKEDEFIEIIRRSLISILFSIDLGVFCFTTPEVRYKAALFILVAASIIMFTFQLVRCLIERKRKEET